MTEKEFNELEEVISDTEMKRIQVEMLKEVAKFCDENSIRYYLTGGTLLGAVRHKGFIPWDDDIDLDMPRPDYDRLIEISNGRIGKYIVMPPLENKDNDALFLKIYDPTTVVKETVSTLNGEKNHFVQVFIDIFPLEGLPSNRLIFKLHCLYVHVLVGFFRTKVNGTSGKSTGKRIIRLFMLPIVKFTNVMFWKKKISKAVRKYNFDESKYIGVLLSRNRFKDYQLKSDYVPYDDSLEFEGYNFHAPSSYHEHLVNLYGDYMKLPPVEMRNSGHTLMAKKVKINGED